MSLRMQAELSTLLFLTQLFVCEFHTGHLSLFVFLKKNKTTEQSYALQNQKKASG